MEFAEDHAAAEFIIHSCSAEGVRVNGQDLTESFMLLPGQPVQAWPVTASEPLKPEHFSTVIEQPELVVLGTGANLRLPDPEISRHQPELVGHGCESPTTGPGDLRDTAESGDWLGSNDHDRGLPNL